MPQIDAKTLKAQLKNSELSNLYYIFGQNIPDVEKLTKYIIKTAVGENEEYALTRLEGRNLDFSELYDMIQMMPSKESSIDRSASVDDDLGIDFEANGFDQQLSA